MKNLVLLFTLCIIAVIFNACASFQEEYKPLYQAKPQVENIKRIK